jgi:CubicO group peptidase (beta-lactamase class C family)
VAKSYLREKNKITATSIKVLPQRIGHREHYPAANGGLFSTASDYAHFCQMLLCEGTWRGKQYLSKQAIQQMTQNQTGKMKVGFVPGSSWGLGFAIVEKPMGTTETLSPGTFGHGGAYGTQAWIDPVKKRIQILMIQCADVGNGDDSPFRRALHEAAIEI